jgi:hypothetical protein
MRAHLENPESRFCRMRRLLEERTPGRQPRRSLTIEKDDNMERTVALKKLGALLGKKMGWRIDPKAPTPEDRAAAQAALPQAIEERKRLQEQRQARYDAILAADAEYQQLLAAHREAVKRAECLAGITRHRKITVGTSEGMFFLVTAEGDSWEEVLGKLSAGR